MDGVGDWNLEKSSKVGKTHIFEVIWSNLQSILDKLGKLFKFVKIHVICHSSNFNKENACSSYSAMGKKWIYSTKLKNPRMFWWIGHTPLLMCSSQTYTSIEDQMSWEIGSNLNDKSGSDSSQQNLLRPNLTDPNLHLPNLSFMEQSGPEHFCTNSQGMEKRKRVMSVGEPTAKLTAPPGINCQAAKWYTRINFQAAQVIHQH